MFSTPWTIPPAPAVVEGSPIADGPCDDVIDDGAFDVLVSVLDDCVRSGASRSTDPFLDATALWVALHGLAQLRAATALFPWPPDVLDVLVDRLAQLR